MAALDPDEKAALRAKEGLKAGTWSFSFGAGGKRRTSPLIVAVIVGVVVGLAAVLAIQFWGGPS